MDNIWFYLSIGIIILIVILLIIKRRRANFSQSIKQIQIKNHEKKYVLVDEQRNNDDKIQENEILNDEKIPEFTPFGGNVPSSAIKRRMKISAYSV